jgi:hypothetical protein
MINAIRNFDLLRRLLIQLRLWCSETLFCITFESNRESKAFRSPPAIVTQRRSKIHVLIDLVRRTTDFLSFCSRFTNLYLDEAFSALFSFAFH